MTEKEYITANQLLTDSWKLAKRVLDSDYKPNFLVALWRGGATIGIAVQEYLEFYGVKTDHIAIRTSAYEGIGQLKKEIKVYGLDYLTETLNSSDKVLIVDDVFDSGLTMNAVLNTFRDRLRQNTPEQIKVATIHYKPKNNKTEIKPDYYLYETDKWLVYPHELVGLSLDEVRKNKVRDLEELFP